MYFLLLLASIINAWEHELTTSVIQKYHAPNSLVNKLSTIKVNKVQRFDDYYIKSDISRIIGVERLNNEFLSSDYSHFKTPEKFLLPFFDRKGRLDFKKSFIISRVVVADYLSDMNDDLVIQLLGIASKTEIYDFAQRNMLQDVDGNIWFVDTQILHKSDYVAAAAEAILDSDKDFLIDGYTISLRSRKKLLSYVSSPISQRRFKDLLPEGMPLSDCE